MFLVACFGSYILTPVIVKQNVPRNGVLEVEVELDGRKVVKHKVLHQPGQEGDGGEEGEKTERDK